MFFASRRVLVLGVLLFCPLLSGAEAVRTAHAGGLIDPTLQSKSLKVYSQITLIRGPAMGSQSVVRDEATWKQWTAKNEQLAKLKVDFSSQMVLIVAEESRGRGKYLFGVDVQDQGDEILAVLHFSHAPPGEPQLKDIIWPNHFIVVDKSDKTVRFAQKIFSSDKIVECFPVAQPIQPKLTITADGADLLVTRTVTANNSPHALQTSYYVDGDGTVHLKYVLIQNTDLLVRSQKEIKVTWRLKGLAVVPKAFSYSVEPMSLTLSTEELGGLMPSLAELKLAGDKCKKTVGQ